MKRETMRDWLASLDKSDRYPIWIISYNRAGKAPFLDRVQKEWDRPGDVNVVVRASQAEDYRSAYPGVTLHALPDEHINNVGKARWAAAELAYSSGDEIIIMMDDDILNTRFLFERAMVRGPNKGKPCSGHNTLEDEEILPDLEERVLNGFTYVCRRVLADNPKAVLGAMIKQHMSFDVKNQETMYLLNGGVTPRAVMVWHLGRMKENGIALNTERFGPHGDDIGMVAEVLKHGGDCWSVPSFVFEHWPESINIKNSVVRSAETKPELHAFEWESLQMYPIKDYLRIKRSIIDGSFEWGDVNWSKYHRLHGSEMKRVHWDEEEILRETYGI